MPRWLGALILLAFGGYSVYLAIADPKIRMRGMKRPLPTWLGRTYCLGIGFLSIIGGLLVWFHAS